jgi:hypothetical protein
MRKNIENQQPSSEKNTNKKTAKKKSRGKTTSELMHRQITNKDAVITDEEFKNIDLETSDLPPQATPETGNLPRNDEVKENKSSTEGDKHKGTITPWDIIED